MSRSLIILLTIALGFFLIIDSVNSAPTRHGKKHARCEDRLYKTLLTLCNHKGNIEIMQATATRCCDVNCDLMEMMSSCVGKTADEEAEYKRDRADIEGTDLF